jgi:hypothetical protein
VARDPKSCVARGIGRSLSPPAAYSIATMGNESLFCMSCAGRCVCARVSLLIETHRLARPSPATPLFQPAQIVVFLAGLRLIAVVAATPTPVIASLDITVLVAHFAGCG